MAQHCQKHLYLEFVQAMYLLRMIKKVPPFSLIH